MNDQSRTPNSGHTPANGDPEGMEQRHFETVRNHTASQEDRWRSTAQIATLILRLLPGARATTGHPRGNADRTDYITVTPNAPLSIFGPDGRFIVSFLKDGSWIEASGRIASAGSPSEGGPFTVAQSILREAGITLPTRGWRPRSTIHPPHSDGLRRLLRPVPTNTWRDKVDLPRGQAWDANTPPSICRESASSRLILASYEPNSCTFASTGQARWGVESLRIPALKDDLPRSRDAFGIEQVHAGDCLVTMGPKFATPDQPDYDDALELDDLEGTLIWHPQRVIRVEPEGADHLRVWVATDNDVMNHNVDPADLNILGLPSETDTKILIGDEANEVLIHFQLNVFCRECGNRAKPIVYGMPGPDEPEYLALGGCIVESDQPLYSCCCGNQWTDVEEEWE